MHRIAVLAVDGVSSLNLAIPLQVFGTAHSLDREDGELFGERLYDVRVYGEPDGISVTTVGSLDLYRLVPEHPYREAVGADTVIVCGSLKGEPPRDLLETIRAAHRRGARIASISGGVDVLAATGLLDGRRVTTHWTYAAQLAERFPSLTVDPDVLFVDDGDVLTSAGAAAGIDLCVHMVRNDFGAAVASEVARHFVMPAERDGGQSQLTVQPEPDAGESLEPTLRWLLRLRVRRAQALLETTTLSVEEIARRCGFGTSVALRQQFANQVGMSPLAYRRAHQDGQRSA